MTSTGWFIKLLSGNKEIIKLKRWCKKLLCVVLTQKSWGKNRLFKRQQIISKGCTCNNSNNAVGGDSINSMSTYIWLTILNHSVILSNSRKMDEQLKDDIHSLTSIIGGFKSSDNHLKLKKKIEATFEWSSRMHLLLYILDTQNLQLNP